MASIILLAGVGIKAQLTIHLLFGGGVLLGGGGGCATDCCDSLGGTGMAQRRQSGRKDNSAPQLE